MANVRISALAAIAAASLSATDVMPITDADAGTPTTYKVTLAQLRTSLLQASVGSGWGSTDYLGLGSGTVPSSGMVRVGQGAITADSPLIHSTATWNSGGVTFRHIFANVTDTASASASLLIDLQVGSSSKFNVTKAGAATFAGAVTATSFTGNLTGNVTGNAATATALETARTINGTSFNGTANITISAATPGTLTFGTYLQAGSTSFSGSNATISTNATPNNTASTLVARDGSGDFSAGTITATFSGNLTGDVTGNVSGSSGSTTGNAATATALATARTINGTSFDGTTNITVTAAAGTLTGTTLNATVTASSLTSVGTLTSLTSTGVVSSTEKGALGEFFKMRSTAGVDRQAVFNVSTTGEIQLDVTNLAVTLTRTLYLQPSGGDTVISGKLTVGSGSLGDALVLQSSGGAGNYQLSLLSAAGALAGGFYHDGTDEICDIALKFSTGISGTTLALTGDLTLTGAGSDVIVAATAKYRLDGSASGNTYISETSADVVTLTVGGQTLITAALVGVEKKLAFYGATTVAQQDVSGSRDGNVALEGLLIALDALGLITDSTSS